jgi:hypothetical protein
MEGKTARCSVETLLSRSSKEHQVVCYHPEEAFSLAAVLGTPGDGTAESSLVSTEGTFGLPPLAEHPLVPVPLLTRAEVTRHLGAVLAARFALVPTRVDRDHACADAQVLPRETVVLLGVERGIGQHPVPSDQQGRQEQDGRELGGIVGRAGGDRGTGDEMGVGVDGGGQLGPGAGGMLSAAAGDEVTRGVPAIQARGIDSDGRLIGDQPRVDCGRDGALEEVDEGPPFKSR